MVDSKDKSRVPPQKRNETGDPAYGENRHEADAQQPCWSACGVVVAVMVAGGFLKKEGSFKR